MNRLLIEGEWIYDQQKIHEAVEQYYADLYRDPIPFCRILEGMKFDGIFVE